jgi:hypothetical protein
MANDVHYIIGFVFFFGAFAIIAPLMNSELGTDLNDENALSNIDTGEAEDPGISTIWEVIINILILPFWTLGLPVMLNLWVMLPIRIVFLFVIARNAWVGGGG